MLFVKKLDLVKWEITDIAEATDQRGLHALLKPEFDSGNTLFFAGDSETDFTAAFTSEGELKKWLELGMSSQN